MNCKTKFSLLIILIFPVLVCAQTNEYGIWTSVGIEKKVGKWDFSVDGEIRSQDVFQRTNRTSVSFEVSRSIVKWLKLGGSYQYMSFYDTKYADYQPRQRYNFFIQGKQDFGRFSFSLRERFQRTIKDESDRIKESGTYDSYKVNPEWTWRNRAKLSYNIPKCPITPSFSFESFYQLNNPDGNTFDQLRYTLTFSYKLNNQNTLEIYGLANKEINVSNPVKTYVAGIGYTFSF
jgi:hypothetical protein